ncbi:MAG: LysR family transcriptional regulator [Burkholderiaceae bacterium]|jgi:DNA-binding transcriptional LysR family regulator
MDFNEVAMFVAVVQAGSFAQAARRTGTPPNTLSRRVLQLETRLGVRLLQRTTRKLALTTQGRQFYERCGEAIAMIGGAGREILHGNEVPSGLIRIAAPVDFFGWFQLEWIAEFLQRHDRVQLEFALEDTITDVVTQGIDLALRGGQLSDSSFVARKLTDSEFILVASPSYVKLRNQPASLAELRTHSCIVVPHPTGRQRWRLEGPAGTEEVEVSGRFSANTGQALIGAAMAGLGIALLPALRALPEIRARRLVHLLPQYRRDGGGFYAIFPSRKHVPLAASAFADFVLEKAKSAFSFDRAVPGRAGASRASRPKSRPA